MADTTRSKADLLALLPDNASGEISPQDLRDLLVSTYGSYGGLYIGSTPPAAQSYDTTYSIMTLWDADSVSTSDVTALNASNNIVVSVAGDYVVEYSLSINPAILDDFVVAVHIDSTEHVPLRSNFRPAANFYSSASAAGIITLAGTETLDLRVKTGASTISTTMARSQFWLKRIG